jgi:ubiquinone/menaquinone biosynthesis C-methylase UbiE
MPEPDIAAMKQQARATWASGDFDAVVPFIWEAGGAAADGAACGPGDRVLDIAAGSGNAAIQAAMRGADVVASDLTPELFEAGRRRAADNGVELEWVEADAEALPFEDASFDAAISTFGIMFAPRQSVAAAELARVVRPGGRIGLASWRPSGFVAEMFATIASFLNPPPPVEAPPVRWGTEDGAHELLDGAFDVTCENRTLRQQYDGSVDEMTDRFMATFGPMVMARKALEPQGRWDEFLQAYRELTRRWDEGDENGASIPADFLLVTGTRRE